jgi:hypothetical protein
MADNLDPTFVNILGSLNPTSAVQLPTRVVHFSKLLINMTEERLNYTIRPVKSVEEARAMWWPLVQDLGWVSRRILQHYM